MKTMLNNGRHCNVPGEGNPGQVGLVVTVGL